VGVPDDDRPKDTPGPAVSRILVIVLTILVVAIYVRSPIDLMPDGAGLIGVIDDLLVALGAMWWLRNRTAPPKPRTTARQRARGPGDFGRAAGGQGTADGARAGAAPQPDEAPWDPYAVLGVRPGATRDEIRDAHRAQMKLYHPDRVADLGPELQAVAHRKSIDIQRAFEELG
jgi:uncharacterized membrane protein YkvA (DUF1232 family)